METWGEGGPRDLFWRWSIARSSAIGTEEATEFHVHHTCIVGRNTTAREHFPRSMVAPRSLAIRIVWRRGRADGLPRRRGAEPRPAKAKSVIQIWLSGGPSHVDSFDPKPEAGNDYCGPLNNPIATNVDGMRIGELLPMLAKQADKYSLIRSMTHGDNGHETAAYLTQTGPAPGDRLVYPALRCRLAVQRLRGRLHRIDSTLHRAHRVTRPLLGSRISARAPHAVRHGRRSNATEVHGGRSRFTRPDRRATTKAARAAGQAQHVGKGLAERSRSHGLL